MHSQRIAASASLNINIAAGNTHTQILFGQTDNTVRTLQLLNLDFQLVVFGDKLSLLLLQAHQLIAILHHSVTA